MDVDMFKSMLFGEDPVEVYAKSKEGKKEIVVNSSIMAVIQILIDKNIVTGNEFDKYQEEYEKLIKDNMREVYNKETLKKDE